MPAEAKAQCYSFSVGGAAQSREAAKISQRRLETLPENLVPLCLFEESFAINLESSNAAYIFTETVRAARHAR